MHRIANSLYSNGYEVYLIGRSKHLSHPLLKMGFNQHRISCWFSKGVLFYIEYNIRLVFFLLKRKVDIVYSVDLDTIIAGSLVRIIKRKRMIFDAHEYFTETPEVIHRPLVKAVWSMVAQLCIPVADRSISVSQSLCDVLTEVYKVPFICIYNAPLHSHQQYGFVTKNKKYILYQGMINKGRGLKEVITAMEHILPDYELWIVGDGDIKDELVACRNESKSKENIHFLGWKSPSELQHITAHATLGLNLLEADGESYYLSLANKFFDYMHAGVPSVNRSFPEYSRIISQFQVGILLDDLDIQSIANQINTLLRDATTYKKMQEECIIANNSYNWQNEEKKLLAALNF